MIPLLRPHTAPPPTHMCKQLIIHFYVYYLFVFLSDRGIGGDNNVWTRLSTLTSSPSWMIAVQAPGVEIFSAAPPLWNQFTFYRDHFALKVAGLEYRNLHMQNLTKMKQVFKTKHNSQVVVWCPWGNGVSLFFLFVFLFLCALLVRMWLCFGVLEEKV